uniref:Kinesin motor domain-containing protein n=1 Tax=Romanomermis culicivorax TaxID=13658 RepID=A0A915IEJ5_ROMCU
MKEENVKVAVRHNDREKTRNAALVLNMVDGKTTVIRDPSNAAAEPKTYTFDYSYWSHDGYKTREDGYYEKDNPRYADQMQVFNDLGAGVLDNAWKGYNCSLFAYGQTGSGKSYSMVGYGANKGIVPLACEQLFEQIERNKSSDVEYQMSQTNLFSYFKAADTGVFQPRSLTQMSATVTVSMLEIYCEKVRDLLNRGSAPKGGLKVREHPKKGFYVDGLIAAPVSCYKAMESKINEGTENRTVAATQMNATSRYHFN